MNRVLGGFKWTMCLVYLDDVVVFGETFEQHQQRLAVVLDCFARSNLVLNPSKCCFGMTEVIFLCQLRDFRGRSTRLC